MITFFVPGVPQPQGSKRAFIHPATGRATLMDVRHEPLRCWRSAIADACQQEWPRPPTTDPVTLKLLFQFTRPKSHFGSGKNSETMKAKAPTEHTTRPDLDKLVRAVKDSLSGVLYRDDSQVFSVAAEKRYDETPGVLVIATVVSG